MNKSTNGVILPTLILVMLFLSIAALGIASFVTRQFSRTVNNVITANALLVAEAGAEQTLYQLNQDSNFSGYTTEQEFFNNTQQGRSTYQTTISNGSLANEKIIVATSRVYRRASDTIPTSERKVRLIVVGTSAPSYSVQTGPGGLIMSNSATIANGDVYVNGYLTMSNSARIGSQSNPTRVWVAHFDCPSGGGPTYPEQCSNGNPITITNNATIYGQVYATNQTNTTGLSSPGLVSNAPQPAVALPSHDRTAITNNITQTITSSDASCSGSQSKTWLANTKVTGNVTLSNNCTVTVLGNIWITGDLTLSNNSKIKVDNAVSQPPQVIIDGPIGLSVNNGTSVLPNTSDLGFYFVAYHSAVSCSPECADVTGSDLYNSRNLTTIHLRNGTLGAGSRFYSRWTKIQVDNNGSLGAVIGQTVQLSNSGNISFGTELSSGSSIWSIKNYQQIFD